MSRQFICYKMKFQDKMIKNMTNVFNSRPFLTYYEGFSELNFFMDLEHQNIYS